MTVLLVLFGVIQLDRRSGGASAAGRSAALAAPANGSPAAIRATSSAPGPGPTFVYPVAGQTLGYDGDYLFRVNPIPNASGYLWGFFQNGVMVWENNRDEHQLSGIEYGISGGSPGHAAISRGPLQVWVRALVNGQWTDATIIDINIV